MNAEVSVAVEDWDGIPGSRLPGICAEARRRSGPFLPSNGLVAEIWRELNKIADRPKIMDLTDYSPEREAKIKAMYDRR